MEVRVPIKELMKNGWEDAEGIFENDKMSARLKGLKWDGTVTLVSAMNRCTVREAIRMVKLSDASFENKVKLTKAVYDMARDASDGLLGHTLSMSLPDWGSEDMDEEWEERVKETIAAVNDAQHEEDKSRGDLESLENRFNEKAREGMDISPMSVSMLSDLVQENHKLSFNKHYCVLVLHAVRAMYGKYDPEHDRGLEASSLSLLDMADAIPSVKNSIRPIQVVDVYAMQLKRKFIAEFTAFCKGEGAYA